MNGRTGILKIISIITILGCIYAYSAFAQVDQVKISYERLNDHVLVVWGGDLYKDQVIAIATEKGILMIDAGKSPTLTTEYRKIIEREFGRNDFFYVINTHFHFDHSSGNQVFPEAMVIAHQKSPALMKAWAADRQNFVKRRRSVNMVNWTNQRDNAEPGSEEWQRYHDYVTTGNVMLDDLENNYKPTLPSITFSDRMTLDLGDATLKLYYWGEGLHTGDDILVYYPEEKLLFAGDLFYKEYFGFAFFPKFDIERWISILDELFDNEIKIEWVYDCHNGRMPGSFISLYHKYMKDMWENLKKAKEEGLDFEAIKKKCSYENKFDYIIKSGLNEDLLKRNHISNLKFTWYNITNMQSAAEFLARIINESGTEVALEKYKKLKNAAEPPYFFDENEFNRLGYNLMNQNKLSEAIIIFKINVELHPGSGNTYDSLGEAYLKNGQKELAIKNYEKSLKLDPGNTNARQVLEDLRKDK